MLISVGVGMNGEKCGGGGMRKLVLVGFLFSIQSLIVLEAGGCVAKLITKDALLRKVVLIRKELMFSWRDTRTGVVGYSFYSLYWL